MRKLIAILAFGLLMIPALAQNHTDYNLPQEPVRAPYIDFASLDQGLWFAFELAPTNFFVMDKIALQVDLLAGYRVNEFLRVGAGIAPRLIAGYFSLPIYADVRGNIISQESRMVVPYWSFDVGYSLGKYERGLYVSPTAGIRIGMPRNNALVGLSYTLQGVPGMVFHGIGIKIAYEY